MSEPNERGNRIQTECELCGHQLCNLVKYNWGAAILSNPKELYKLQNAKYNRTVARFMQYLVKYKRPGTTLVSILLWEFKRQCGPKMLYVKEVFPI